MAESNSVKQEVPCAEGLGAFFFLSWCRLLAHQSGYLQKQKSSLAEIQIRRIFQDYLNSFALCVILQQNRQISMSPKKVKES